VRWNRWHSLELVKIFQHKKRKILSKINNLKGKMKEKKFGKKKSFHVEFSTHTETPINQEIFS
jgi:hypothetical protein